MPAKQLKVALDWTPNANHAGFYVAKSQGLYSEAGLEVCLSIPDADYATTPASKVASGAVQFAVIPSETAVSYATQPQPGTKPKLKVIAALLQKDPSAIATLKGSGISRPRDLDGKVYASYGARYEGRIVKQLIKNDGGSGAYTEQVLPSFGIFEALKQGKADATWIFANIEGVAAKHEGVDLNLFHLSDFDIPYGYSPVLAADESFLRDNEAVTRNFVAATARGYQWAASHPEEAAEILTRCGNEDNPGLSPPLDATFVRASMAASVHYFLNEGKWGCMDQRRWDAFLDWLSDQGLLTTKMQSRVAPVGGTATLDELRDGDAGQAIPRSAISSSSIVTNSYLICHD